MRQEKHQLHRMSSISSSLKLPSSQRGIAIWPQQSCDCECPVTKSSHFLCRNGKFKLCFSILKLPPLSVSEVSILKFLLQALKGNSESSKRSLFKCSGTRLFLWLIYSLFIVLSNRLIGKACRHSASLLCLPYRTELFQVLTGFFPCTVHKI